MPLSSPPKSPAAPGSGLPCCPAAPPSLPFAAQMKPRSAPLNSLALSCSAWCCASWHALITGKEHLYFYLNISQLYIYIFIYIFIYISIFANPLSTYTPDLPNVCRTSPARPSADASYGKASCFLSHVLTGRLRIKSLYLHLLAEGLTQRYTHRHK